MAFGVRPLGSEFAVWDLGSGWELQDKACAVGDWGTGVQEKGLELWGGGDRDSVGTGAWSRQSLPQIPGPLIHLQPPPAPKAGSHLGGPQIWAWGQPRVPDGRWNQPADADLGSRLDFSPWLGEAGNGVRD